MKKKAHGTCDKAVMKNLRFGTDWKIADKICCFNRHYAENSGYAWGSKISWVNECRTLGGDGEITYYDSVTGKPLFVAPRGRTME